MEWQALLVGSEILVSLMGRRKHPSTIEANWRFLPKRKCDRCCFSIREASDRIPVAFCFIIFLVATDQTRFLESMASGRRSGKEGTNEEEEP